MWVLNEGGRGGEKGSYLTVLRVEVASAHSPLGHLSELEVLATALVNPINTRLDKTHTKLYCHVDSPEELLLEPSHLLIVPTLSKRQATVILKLCQSSV